MNYIATMKPVLVVMAVVIATTTTSTTIICEIIVPVFFQRTNCKADQLLRTPQSITFPRLCMMPNNHLKRLHEFRSANIHWAFRPISPPLRSRLNGNSEQPRLLETTFCPKGWTWFIENPETELICETSKKFVSRRKEYIRILIADEMW